MTTERVIFLIIFITLGGVLTSWGLGNVLKTLLVKKPYETALLIVLGSLISIYALIAMTFPFSS